MKAQPSSSKKHLVPAPFNGPAKLGPPVLKDVVDRTHTYELIDSSRARPIVWISAPGGSGKTTLVAAYVAARQLNSLWYRFDATDEDIGSFFHYIGLAAQSVSNGNGKQLPIFTRDYLAGLAAFSANFFRELYLHLERPSVIVLDNFQDMPAGSVVHQILQQGMDQVPAGVQFVVASRSAPPGEFARLRANEKISFLGWEQLRLTEEECFSLAKLRCSSLTATKEFTSRLYDETQGWAAGVVLLGEQLINGAKAQPPSGLMTHQSIFEYFAAEILARADDDVRCFLFATSFLRTIAPSVALELTGIRRSSEILQDLTNRNFFTTFRADGSFEYHPLFRSFLKSQAEQFYAPDGLRALIVRSGQLLIATANVDDGVDLLLNAEAWQLAAESLHEFGPKLVRQGRSGIVASWLDRIPTPVVDADPWLLYVRGICRIDSDAALARVDFFDAFAMFEKQDDATPVYLCWSRIVESYLAEMNDFTPMVSWLKRYESLQTLGRRPTESVENISIFVYIAGLTNACCDSADLPLYVARAERIIDGETRIERRAAYIAMLIPYFIWQGADARAAILIERFDAISRESTNTRVLLEAQIWKTLRFATVSRTDESLRSAQSGLELGRSTGMHRADSQLMGYAILGLANIGNITAARSLLDRLSKLPPSGKVGEANFCHYASIVSLHEGEFGQAATYGERAVTLADSASLAIGSISYRIGLAAIYSKCGNFDAASALLEIAKLKAIAMKSRGFISFCDFFSAAILLLRGETDRAVDALAIALSVAKACGIVTATYCPRDIASELYNLALERSVCSDYVRTMIVATGLSPPRDRTAQNWPWPVRILTLGRFLVMRKDAPLLFAGKAQKKPLELLKMLIAFGGVDVSANMLARALWPDADGDVARATLRSTLLRLRRLIGDQSIVQQGESLSLNSNYCWVDVWALERALLRADFAEPVFHVEAVLRLYRGAFLADEDTPPIIEQRERLRSKVLRTVVENCKRLEACKDISAAITLYQMGVETDPLAEELHRRLMQCYRLSSRPIEALAVYHRLQKALSRALRIEPTAETKSLYREIQRQVG